MSSHFSLDWLKGLKRFLFGNKESSHVTPELSSAFVSMAVKAPLKVNEIQPDCKKLRLIPHLKVNDNVELRSSKLVRVLKVRICSIHGDNKDNSGSQM